MDTNISLRIDDFYWEILKNLNSDMKLRLISRLSESLQSKINSKETDDNIADQLYGSWKDDRSAEEQIDEIRKSRTFRLKIENWVER